MDNIYAAGLDIGNGYVKGMVGNLSAKGSSFTTIVDMPSCAAVCIEPPLIPPDPRDYPDIIKDLSGHLDASFDSPLIKDKNRFIFGSRGAMSGASLMEFDVYSSVSKAKQPLSAMLVLSCIASHAIADYYNKNHDIPKAPLAITAKAALALPIREFKKYRDPYAKGYMDTPHRITVYNFATPITLEISFSSVRIVAEGASAQYAINTKGPAFMDACIADAASQGFDLSGITGEDILSARGIVGIDIGEGTVNFPVVQDGVFSPDLSFTFDKGYGAVLSEALSHLQDIGYAFSSRKALQEYLNRGPTNLTKNKYDKIQQVVDDRISAFIMEVMMEFSKVMSRVGAFTEVIFVYGGGASPLRYQLYPLLLDSVRSFGGGDAFAPVIYLDSRYSRCLNREGLYMIACAL